MIARCLLVLLACTILAAAQTAPGKTKVIKDEKGMCQALVPAEALTVLPYLAQGPQQSYSVILDQDGDPSRVLSAADLQTLHYSKAYENTAARQIVEKEPHAVSAGFRAIHVYLPLPKGRCHAGISFKTSVSEDAMKRVAMSVTRVK
jgi:hypothetical protein